VESLSTVRVGGVVAEYGMAAAQTEKFAVGVRGYDFNASHGRGGRTVQRHQFPDFPTIGNGGYMEARIWRTI
jgi:hypothetical protein